MIYTTYFAKLKKLPKDIIPVAICSKCPDWYTGLQYKALNPKYDFFMYFKKTGDACYFSERYRTEILAGLNQATVIQEIFNLTGNRNFALVCYEKSSSFCHRHLVAEWLRSAGYACTEFVE